MENPFSVQTFASNFDYGQQTVSENLKTKIKFESFATHSNFLVEKYT